MSTTVALTPPIGVNSVINGTTTYALDANGNVSVPPDLVEDLLAAGWTRAILGLGSAPAAAKALGLTVEELGNDAVHMTKFTFTNFLLPIASLTNLGSGSIKIYDFPAGLLAYYGATTNLAISRVGTGIAADAEVIGALGTTTNGTDNATLTTTEASFVPSTAGTLTAGVGAIKGKSTATQAPVHIDGTSTAVDLFLNIAAPAAKVTEADTLKINGSITLLWANLGDN